MKRPVDRGGLWLIVLIGTAAAWSAAAEAQARQYVARLTVVPLTVAMQDTIAGRGTATATLEGNRLVIDGTFEGLRSPATVARLHMAPRAMRGPAIANLTVSQGVRGTVRGSIELDARQREALDRSSLYIQIHSEKAPDGNLWGWIFPQEEKR